MKYLIYIYILAAIIISPIKVYAQNGNGVDIRVMVKEQIVEAQRKQLPVKQVSKIEKPVIVQSSTNLLNIIFTTDIDRMLIIKIAIMLLAAILSLFIILYRRRRLKRKEEAKKFKQNIKLIREENVFSSLDHTSIQIRKKLMQISGNVKHVENSIGSLAKKLNISSGEILLANRLNIYKLENEAAGRHL